MPKAELAWSSIAYSKYLRTARAWSYWPRRERAWISPPPLNLLPAEIQISHLPLSRRWLRVGHTNPWATSVGGDDVSWSGMQVSPGPGVQQGYAGFPFLVLAAKHCHVKESFIKPPLFLIDISSLGRLNGSLSLPPAHSILFLLPGQAVGLFSMTELISLDTS